MSTPFGALRRLAAGGKPVERCELCAVPLDGEHQHLVDPRERRLLCACDACAILFDDSGVTSRRRVPRDTRELVGMDLDDAAWTALDIPIGLAFIFRSSATASLLAIYPSPAGPTETPVEGEAWRDVAALHPSLAAMRPDVEALLVNRIHGAREYYLAPIDRCYRLAGLVRLHWSGFSGGDELWRQIRAFFDELRQHSRPERIARHA